MVRETRQKIPTKIALACALLLTFASGASAENEPIPEPECDSTKAVSIRYAATSARLYLEAGTAGDRGGCIRLTEIFEARAGKAPLYAVDPSTGNRVPNATGTWLLTTNLFVEDGITLNVHGGVNGDADELRLLSDNTTFINVRAYGGSLSFHDTKVVAWNEGANAVDLEYETGRSYISAVSEFLDGETCDGRAKNERGEARLDIVNSEMAYLGYQASESYGLTWKVRGFCRDKSNPEIFDAVNVYGNIYDSDIHHNYFGMYSYGHQQGDWRRNKMHDNVVYGFDPHDDSDFLNIHDNIVYNNGNHGIIASRNCNGVSIQNNEVYGGGQAGLFLHRSSDDAIVKGNYVHDNANAGLAMLESFNARISENVFENNLFGVRMSVGCANNIVSDNDIIGSTRYAAYTYEGSDAPDVVGSGFSMNNSYIGNRISGAGVESVRLKESSGMEFRDNVFADATNIRFDESTNVLMVGNTGLENVEVAIRNGACFDAGSDEGFQPLC